MKSPVVNVRCYGCGRLQRRDASCCERCGTTFDALCGCGAAMSVYDHECPACRAPHLPNRVPASKLPWVRSTKWTLGVLGLGAAAWIALHDRQKQNWQLRLEAGAALKAGDADTAARLALEATDQNPSDAQAWYLLAIAYRELKFPPSVYIPDAETALKAKPDFVDALDFLARAELELGHVDRALEHALAATKVVNPTGGAWLLLAKIELKRRDPNLLVVKDALDRAAQGGRDTDEVKLLRADVELRLLGGIGGGPERLPTSVAATLRSALAVYESRGPGDVADDTNRARILIALGEAEKAYGAASAALARVPAGSPPEATAEIRMLCAMALYSRGNHQEAIEHFASVLADRPDAPTAAAASAFLASANDADSARALLARAAKANDPKGALHAVLATLLLEQGELDGASKAIESARGAAPRDPAYAEILGTVRTAQGRFDDARAAYGDAVAMAPEMIRPRVRLALLPLSERPAGGADTARIAQAVREVEELRTKFGDDPFLLEGLGRLRLAAGDAAGAVEVLETASRRSPANPDVWLALAAARRGSGTETALDDAGSALARARRLRPTSSAIALAEAETWLAAGRPDVAVATCTEFLRQQPGDADVLRTRARAYRELGMWNVVVADLRRVAELRRGSEPLPADELDTIDLVDALHRSGDRNGALQMTERMQKSFSAGGLRLLAVINALNEGDAGVAMQRLRENGPSILLAEIQIGSGRGDEALETLRSLWKSLPGDPTTARLLVATLLGPVPVAPERLDEARAVAQGLGPSTPPGLRDLVGGRILLAEGKAADAEAPLRAATLAQPSDALAWLFLAEALFVAGDRVESLADFRKATLFAGAHQPTIARIAAVRMHVASLETRDLARAEELALEALRLDPLLVGAAYRAAQLLHARGEYVRAAEIVEAELKVPGIPPDDAAKLRLAAALERLWSGDFTLAETHADALPAELRRSPGARLATGFAGLGAGHFADATREFESVLAEDPANSMAAYGLVRASVLRGGSGRMEGVARAVSWCEAHPDDRHLAAAASRLFVTNGLPDDAVRLARRTAERHPDDLAVAANLAATLKRVGRAAEAVDVLARFAAKAEGDEGSARARLVAATLCVRCGIDVETALRTARGLAAEPAAPPSVRLEAETLVAEALMGLDRLDEAERGAQAVLAALAASPVRGRAERALDSRANFVIGFVAASSNPPRRAQAQEAYLRCTDLDRDNLDAANNLAFVMAKDASTAARALELARRVVAEAPQDAGYRDTLAEAAYGSGEYQEAEAAWTKSLELLADATGAAARRRARIALRFAEFLRGVKKTDLSRRVATDARAGISGTEEDRALARFLEGTP